MIVLFNAAGSSKGGAVKNAALFIKYSLKSDNIEWYYAISEKIMAEIESMDVFLGNRAKVFKVSPAKNLKVRHELKSFSHEVEADLVYTMAGPAYVSFRQEHVQGISNPYVTHAKWAEFKLKYTLKDRLLKLANTAYQAFKSIDADYFFFQTEQSRDGFCRRYRVKRNITSIVPNAVDPDFLSRIIKPKVGNSINDSIVIFSPAAPYSHKALQFLPAIAQEIKSLKPNLDFKFRITIDKQSRLAGVVQQAALKYKVQEHIENIGPFRYMDLEQLYEESDFVFVPSLLETYSASYLEAMSFSKPLIAADRDFAKEVCKDAAFYVEPLNFAQTAKRIVNLIESSQLQNSLLNEAAKVLSKKLNQEERFKLIEKNIYSILRN